MAWAIWTRTIPACWHTGRCTAGAAERKEIRDVVRKRGTAGGNDGESAAEADSHHSDAVIRGEARLGRQPNRGALDRVGDLRLDLEPRKLRNIRRHNGETVAGQLPR